MWRDEPTEKAVILTRLFDNYKTNLSSKTKIYRGMSVPEELFEAMGYHTLKKGDSYSPDERAIASFSVSNRVAYKYANDGEHQNKVVIKLETNNENALNITEISSDKDEKEVILNKDLWYTIKQIKKINQRGAKWLLIVLE